MTIQEIEKTIVNYRESNKKIFVTSSFQTHSIPLLHILSQIDKSIPIYFINTGFLFPETIEYKNEVAKLLGMSVVDSVPLTVKSEQKDGAGCFFYASDPDHCCYLNKVQPLDGVMKQFDVWINGVRADQTEVRKGFQVEQEVRYGCMRFHPMLDWTKQDIFRYIRKYNLPHHPLDILGYSSIGCEPCTRKPSLDDEERNSRWFGMSKTECGLNTMLINKEE